MSAHVHFDVLSGLWGLGFVVLGLHTMRAIGAIGASRGVPGAAVLGGLATFN